VAIDVQQPDALWLAAPDVARSPVSLPGQVSPLGATPGPGGTNFAVWAPDASRVWVCLFDENGREERVELVDRRFDTWYGRIAGVGHGQRYGYRVDGPWDPHRGHRFNPSKLLLDPYARAVTGDLRYDAAVFGHHRPRSPVDDPYDEGDDLSRDDRDSAPYVPKGVVVGHAFDWSGDRQLRIPWSRTVLYELHVRGHTMRHPDVPEHLRGTYAGLAHPAVLGRLVDLGVTTVELMPVHHFVNETHLAPLGLRNFWGYNSLAFFAPHAGYSASGSLGQQVEEFRHMVKAFHAAGLEVVLDVVYNHTAEQGRYGPTLSMRGLANRHYYRLEGGGRSYRDYTGCGNTLDLRVPHVLQLVMDSLRWWVSQMHVDGFRFDLASALARSMHDVDMLGPFFTVIAQDPLLREVKLIAEPWDVGPGGYQVGEFPHLWTEWNDQYRDAVRDHWRGAAPGVRELAMRLSGSSDLYADDGRRPFASINYVTSHDGYPLRDLVSYEHRHNWANGEGNRDGHHDNRSANYGVEGETDDDDVLATRRRQQANFLVTLLLSTGVPMLLAGDELGRTQAGNNNAYCQDNDTTWLDWASAPDHAELEALVRQLLRLRREHPVFRQRHFFAGRPAVPGGRKDLAWFAPDGQEMTDHRWWDLHLRTLGVFLAGDGIRSRHRDGTRIVDDSYLWWLHAGPRPQQVHLPGGVQWSAGYEVVLDTGLLVPHPDDPSLHRTVGTVLEGGTDVVVAPRSTILLRAVPGVGNDRGP
jgi:glycogen operon protein